MRIQHNDRQHPSRSLTTRLKAMLLPLLTACTLLVGSTASGQAPSGQSWEGSYQELLSRRLIRVAVEYDRTLYFNDHGLAYGLAVDVAHELASWLGQRHAGELKGLPVQVQLVPMPRGRLLEALEQGQADIALGYIAAGSPDRAGSDLTIRIAATTVEERIVTGPTAHAIVDADDLAGMHVHTTQPARFYTHIQTVNQKLLSAGKKPIVLVESPKALDEEDLLQMVNAGLVDAMIVSDWKARLWRGLLPNLILNNFQLSDGGAVGWAVRNSDQLLGNDLDAFTQELVATGGMDRFRQTTYKKKVRSLKNLTNKPDWLRFESLWPTFREYAKQYNLDPLLLAALGYQETALNQSLRSPSGAIGIMQLMPSTGVSMGVGHIEQAQANIHAGAKYLDSLLKQNFPDAAFTSLNRTLFAIASYNAGPAAIARLRAPAAAQGFDPDVWLGNVEIVAAQKIGVEVMTYVRNVYKYYVTYQLKLELLQ